MMKDVLVTGAAGFIGHSLCARLVNEDRQVLGAVRKDSSERSLVSGVKPIHIGALGPDTDWSEALEGVDTVIHLAARVHVMGDVSEEPLSAYRLVNVSGTERLARMAADHGVRRLIFLSSVKVHGEENALPYRESVQPSPMDPYGISKYEAEEVLIKVAAETSMEIVIIRPPLVYGPGVKANFLKLLKLTQNGFPLPLGSVYNRRNMVYVGNLVNAIITCMEHPRAAGETFLVCDGEDVSTAELVRKIASAMGRKATLLPVPLRMLKTLGSLTGKMAVIERLTGSLRVDSGKIREILDWQPPYTLEQGIQETVDWYLGRG